MAVVDVLTDEESPAGIMRRPDALVHASRRRLVARVVPVASVVPTR